MTTPLHTPSALTLLVTDFISVVTLQIVFVAELAALSVKLFELVEDAEAATFASVTILGNQLATSLFL